MNAQLLPRSDGTMKKLCSWSQNCLGGNGPLEV